MKEKLRTLFGLVPGILLLIAVGYAGKITEKTINAYTKTHHIPFPNIEYVLWAIVFGIVIFNLVKCSWFLEHWFGRIFAPGIKTYEFFLKVGIVLLGSRFIFGDILKLGGPIIALVIIEIAVSLLFMTWLGRKFRLDPELVALSAMGVAICGVSAIIAGQGAINAKKKFATIAITAILTIGALDLFSYPPIGHALHLSDKVYGVWAGLSVDNTAEAVATGMTYSDAAGKTATLVKTCRNAMIGFVVLGYAILWAKRGMTKQVTNKGLFLWQKFPKFVLGFLAISLLATIAIFSKGQLTSLANGSRWAFLLTFAGVGLSIDVREMWEQSARPFLVCALGELGVASFTLVLVLLSDRPFVIGAMIGICILALWYAYTKRKRPAEVQP
jgi:uncharacterized integral membrane protein (TIGR00698 family)